MIKTVKIFLVCFGILMLSGLSFAQTSVDDNVLITVGDEKVKVSDFLQVYEKNNTQTDKQDPGYLNDYLDLYINFKLKVKEAEALKLDTVSSFIKELHGYREQLAKPYFIDESVNEALLKEAYERKLYDIRASHILIMVDENAKPEDTLAAYEKVSKIRTEILNGKSFEDAAVEYSDDPSAKDRNSDQGQQRFKPGNKGDLGYFTVFNMVYPFENAAYVTEPGQVSKPVRTKFGYHLIYVKEKRPALGLVQVAHIFVASRPDATPEDEARKLEKINNIYAKIQEGMPFEEAVVQYSEDKGSARNGGELSKFTCNRVVPEFVEATSALEVGEISAPVKTLYGYHIIRLISRETPGTFEEEADQLKERVTKDNRAQKSKEAVINKIKSENKIKLYEKAKVAAFNVVDSTVLAKQFSTEGMTVMTEPVMKIGKLKFTQNDFLKFVEKNQQKQDNIDKEVYLERMFGDFVDENCLAFEDMQLESKYPDFKILMQEYHDGILLFNLTDEMVWSKAVKDTIGLQRYFDTHRGDYVWGERVNATVYQISKQEDVEKVLAIVTELKNGGDVANRLKEDSITSVKITPDIFEKGDNKSVDQVEWKAGNLQLLNSDVEQMVTIVRINELLAPGVKELKEARGLVTADYQNYLEENWIKELREKYPVTVNEEVLKILMSEK